MSAKDQTPSTEEPDRPDSAASPPVTSEKPQLPEPADLNSVRGLMLALVTVCLFCVSVLFGPDEIILPADGNLEIPIANIKVRLGGFLFFGPLVILCFTLYLHIFYEAVTTRLKKTGEFSDQFIFTMRNVAARLVTGFIFYLMPCVVLFAFAFRMLPRPESKILLGVSAIFLAFMSVLYVWRRVWRRNVIVFIGTNMAIALLLMTGFYFGGPDGAGWWESVRSGLQAWRPLNLVKAKLRQRDLRDIDLTKANMRDADLSGAILRDATLDNATVTNAQAKGADMRRARLVRAQLQYANLAEADLHAADLRGAVLIDADLQEASISNANLNPVLNPVRCQESLDQKEDDPVRVLERHGGQTPCVQVANLTGANLTGADLRYATLIGATLTTAQLDGVELAHAKLIFAELEYTKLTSANLALAWLTCGSLVGADLSQASLVDANMAGVDFTDAKLDGAHLDNAGLSCFQCNVECLEACLSCAEDASRTPGMCDRDWCSTRNCQHATRDEATCAQFVGTTLIGASLEEAELRHSTFVDANLERANLKGADLYGALLKDTDLHLANLKDANLQDATLKNVNLSGSRLMGADLNAADIEGTNLLLANLTGVKGLDCEKLTTGVNWQAAIRAEDLKCSDGEDFVLDFRKVDFRGIDINLFETVFSQEPCDSSNYPDCLPPDILEGALMNNVKLYRFNLRGVTLPKANLQKADLREAILEGADLRKANLQRAQLRGANLHNSLLSGATLSHADLTGAIFDDALLSGADLREASGLTCKQLQSAKDWRTAVRDKSCGTPIPESSEEQTEKKAEGITVLDSETGGFVE